MTFQKGQSGNPGGKSVTLADGRTLTDVAREHTLEAVQTLVAVMLHGESEAARVSAAIAVADRGWGRPRQDLTVEMQTDESFADMLGAARKRAAESQKLGGPCGP